MCRTSDKSSGRSRSPCWTPVSEEMISSGHLCNKLGFHYHACVLIFNSANPNSFFHGFHDCSIIMLQSGAPAADQM